MQSSGWKIVHRQMVDCIQERGQLTFYEREGKVDGGNRFEKDVLKFASTHFAKNIPQREGWSWKTCLW